MMSVFELDDPVGMVKRFEVGEYKGNRLPLIYTKTRNCINPVNKKPSFAMTIKVEKDGKLFDIHNIGMHEVFAS